jgi:3-oxoacyl-[acyl-carrier protein] reductase
MTQQLDNQIAIVTGGNAGIGKAIVQLLAEQGAQVHVFGTNLDKGLQVAATINQTLQREAVYFYQVDVAHTEAVDTQIKQLLQQYGQVDILVNNAGITKDQLLMKMSEEDWDRVLDVNVKSCYNTCKAVVRAMLKKRKGKIVNISSVVGLMGNAGQANYAASKAAMIGFTKALAKELASKDRQITVNCVAPGYIETDMTAALSEEQRQGILTNVPLARMGAPDDIARAVLFLVSKDADYITGQVLTVDGGMVM